MNIMRQSWNNICYSPDEPAAPEPDVEVAVESVAAEPVVEPEPVEPAPVEIPAAPAPAMVPLRVMQERVGEETSRRQAAEERERQAVDRAKSFEEITKRLQANPSGAQEQPRDQPVRQQPSTVSNQDAIQQAAAQMVFQRDLQGVVDAGAAEYGQKWEDVTRTLDACWTENAQSFAGAIMEIDPLKAHEIMFQISQNPERAVAMAKMTPARRFAEITRMSDMAKAAVETKTEPKPEPKVAAISKAPSPKPAMAPHAPAPDVDPTTPEGNEKMDDRDFEAWYKNKYVRKSA